MTKEKGPGSKKKKKKKQKKQPVELVVSKEEFFRLMPVVSPFANIKKQTDEELLIWLDTTKFKKKGLVKRIMPSPSYKQILLDKLGMDVFLICDGKHTVKDIFTIFHEKYRLTLAESQVSVQKYLMSLADRHLIGFLIPKRIAEKNKLDERTVDKILIEST